MDKRQITMQDGRYLIFYTFPEKAASSPSNVEENQQGSAAEREPEAKPEAREERSV
jgi:hypothetical protein